MGNHWRQVIGWWYQNPPPSPEALRRPYTRQKCSLTYALFQCGFCESAAMGAATITTKEALQMNIRVIVTTTVLILAIIAVSTTTSAALSCSGDICVDPTGWQRDGGAFNASEMPIQAAVDNANAGETICVAAGSYNGAVDVNKRLTLRGEGADLVTVTAASNSVFEVTSDYVNISGFNVTGATGWLCAGIYLNSMQHCNISNNIASNNYYGIRLLYSSNNTLLGNTANSNEYHGIYVSYSSNNTLIGSTVSNNNDSIRLYSSNNNTLLGNTANSNSDEGIHLYDSNNNTLLGNIANSNNDSGIHLFVSHNNTLDCNIATLNADYGIHLWTSCNNKLVNNNASSNHNNNVSSDTGQGIYAYASSNNTLLNNTANSNKNYGIWLCISNNNTLFGNTASNNCDGIYLYSSCNNDVTCNLVQNNTDCGMYRASESTGNNITWNNIVANGELQTDGSYYYQFKNSQLDGVDASNNFWGAGMNENTINASIYEVGLAVEFYPFEADPVPCAPIPISEELPAFTTADAMIALEIAVGSRPLDLRYDVSGDGQVTSLDALMILQAVAGNITL